MAAGDRDTSGDGVTTGDGVTIGGDGVAAGARDGVGGMLTPPGKVSMRGLGLPCPRGCGLAFEAGAAVSGASPIETVRLAKSLPVPVSSGLEPFALPSTELPAGRVLRKIGDFAGVDRSPDPIVSYHPPEQRTTPPRPFSCSEQQWSGILQWRQHVC